MENKKEIIDFVKNNSYFDFEGEEDGMLNFSTRKNGSVSSETASSKDITEGKSIKSKIEDKFKGLDIKIEVVDEWVLLFVSEKKTIKDEYKYTFKKDLKGAGFSSSFNSMEELIDRYGSWIDVNWDNIKKEVNKITDYPNDTFSGWMESNPMILKRAGEEGNTWGYNFYLIKSKKKNRSYKGGGSIDAKGTFASLGSAKELGIIPKIAGHDMIAKCDCGEKFSYQNSKKDILWQCPECNGMKKLDTTKMVDGGSVKKKELISGVLEQFILNTKFNSKIYPTERFAFVIDKPSANSIWFRTKYFGDWKDNIQVGIDGGDDFFRIRKADNESIKTNNYKLLGDMLNTLHKEKKQKYNDYLTNEYTTKNEIHNNLVD